MTKSVTDLAGRSYARIYPVARRSDLAEYLRDAVERSGGTALWTSPADRAPLYFGIQGRSDERIGLLCYPFRCSPTAIKGRAPDEHRLQIRYGSEASWAEDHPLGRDVAGVDVTIVVGVHLAADIIVGLDPSLYDPLPMGISIEFRQPVVDQAVDNGWTVWERETRSGVRRGKPRTPIGVETLVAFRPERLLDYVQFERYASSLGLDPPLRFKAAEEAATGRGIGTTLHNLEEQFELSGREILDIITDRHRLHVAVRGGVAEHHLERALSRMGGVEAVRQIDEDGKPDFEIVLTSGRHAMIECKNVSPIRRGADIKVEVQKTRASKADPASRFYVADQFDLVAASLWPVTGEWEFRFKSASLLARHSHFPDRLAPIQIVDDSWSHTPAEALA
jgi:hypothetical protein